MKSVFYSIVCVIVLAMTSFAQTPVTPAQPFPNQFFSAGMLYNQQTTQGVQGFVAYAKLTSASSGIYSYTKVSETSIALKPVPSAQTQTETGICMYGTTFHSFDLFGCGTVGIAAASNLIGVSTSGTMLATHALSKGWTVGLAVGPTYSGVSGKVTYPVGLVFGWGK